MRLTFPLVCLILAAALPAQEAPRPGPGTVRGQGEATVTARPDQVRIEIGVVTQAQTAESAAGQNAKQTADVLATLKKELAAAAEVQTSGYSIQPNYRHSRDGNAPPTIVGYTASNMVQVKSTDVSTVAKVIDAATRAGANNIHGIQFTLKDEQNVRAEALRQATRNARASAEAMAAGLNMKLGRIVQISEGEANRVMPVRMEMMRAQADAGAATPIEPGNVQVRAVVTVTAELAP
jgi:uncharacterized protein YggE